MYIKNIKRESLQEHEPLPSSGSNKDSTKNLSIGGTREVPISSPSFPFDLDPQLTS